MPGTKETPHPNAIVDIGVQHHKAGRLREAESYYRKALEIDPAHPGALYYLANMANDDGRIPLAKQLAEKLLRNEPNNAGAWHLLGTIAHKEENFTGAVEYLNKALAIQPAYVLAYFSLSDALSKQGEFAAALANYDKMLSRNPNFPEAYIYRGLALENLKRPDEAVSSYNKAIALNPNIFEAYYNRGNALRDLKRLDEAVASYNQALALRPDVFQVHYNRGRVLRDLKRFDEALASYDKVIALKSDFAGAYNERGVVLKGLDRPDEALANYDKAIALDANFAEAYHNRGNRLKELERLDEALINYDKALSLKPDDAEIHYNRGNTLKEAIKLDAARKDFEKVLQLKPDHYQARWVLGLMDIPAMFRAEDDVETSRAAFARALRDLDEWFDSSRLNGAEEAVATTQPFYLAYQEKNNKDLLSDYGRLTRRLMEHWQSAHAIHSKGLAGSGKIKVGVVSSHVRGHSVWDAIAKGWLLNFDSSRFEWHVFSLGSIHNSETELIRSRADFFVEGLSSLKEWASRIVENRIEVLIYPEIGMNALTAKLANLRLAPLQIATWGHPETTGIETIDYYLSADLLEPDNADSNYSEALITLPNLGCTYAPHQVTPAALDLSKLGINTGLPILLCPGTAYKYSPQHDGVFPRIASALERCTFVFFDQAPHLTAMLKSRLKTAFEKENLAMADYVKFIPWQPREVFYTLMKAADVFMDTIGFSGFNTAIQAIECSLPIVTVDGRFMRGRLASGILKRLDIPEVICDSEKTYCDVVVRLVKDENFRTQVVSKIESRRALLYDDMEPLRTMEKFLLSKCRHT